MAELADAMDLKSPRRGREMRLARRIIGTFVASHVGDDRGNEPREKKCGVVDARAP